MAENNRPRRIPAIPEICPCFQGPIGDCTRISRLSLTRVAGMFRCQRVGAVYKRFGVVLLIAMWLLGTVHCGLEAAVDLFASQEAQPAGCCNDAGASCATDECDAVEGALYRSDATNLQIAAPQVLAADYFCALPAMKSALAGCWTFEPCAFERASDWTPSWQFVRRAAPLPGAPSSAVV